MSRALRFSIVLGSAVAALLLVRLFAVGDELRIYPARVIWTLEEHAPRASAIAVRDGRIAAIGSLDEVRAQLGEDAGRATVDRRFEELVIFPGFIDPHLHPTLASTILPMEIVSSVEWSTPRGRTRAVRDAEGFAARLRELDAALRDPEEWLYVWGHHAPYHGPLSRARLDAISTTRPIFVWQRSVHEMFFNSAALERLGFEKAAFDAHPHADWERGHLWETGLFSLGQPMVGLLAAPTRYRRGLSMMSEVIHRGGLTTVAEQGFPQVSAALEWTMLQFELWGAPYRFALVPNAMFLTRQEGSPEAAEASATRLLRWSTDRVRVLPHAKLYADGAIFSQLMQMSEPYLDGHHGAWMMTPAEQSAVVDRFWDAGWHLHIHVNGDAGLTQVLDTIEAARARNPDPERRVVLEHYGYAREEQHARVAALGVEVSNNAYYAYELAPPYAAFGLGPERAADLSPLGGLARAGVPFSFHSDFPMAPAEPLRLVSVAVNRIASDGQVWGPHQRVSLEQALRAVTIDAARHLGLEDEIGSLRVGKRADFTILEQDPFELPPEAIEEIPIWGTVLDGVPHPIPASR